MHCSDDLLTCTVSCAKQVYSIICPRHTHTKTAHLACIVYILCKGRVKKYPLPVMFLVPREHILSCGQTADSPSLPAPKPCTLSYQNPCTVSYMMNSVLGAFGAPKPCTVSYKNPCTVKLSIGSLCYVL
jgi:hypothetical protein